jgi:hypothetical protein
LSGAHSHMLISVQCSSFTSMPPKLSWQSDNIWRWRKTNMQGTHAHRHTHVNKTVVYFDNRRL